MADPARLKLVLSYDGRSFSGWQSQKNSLAIQDQVEGAIAKICGRRIAVIGAGRTDAGVHALGQCAHCDVPRGILTPARWLSALNGNLPPSIRVLRVSLAAKSFHARFSAKAKTYRYRIVTTEVLSPFELDRAWHVRNELSLDQLREVARVFIGRHDFAGFAANRGHPPTDTVREIESLRVVQRGAVIRIEVTGSGFLYKMVRLMVGAIVRCVLGKETMGELRQRLTAGTRWKGERFVAPAGGLYLLRVRY